MKIHSHARRLSTDMLDAFCVLQQGFTDQFVYYDKERPARYMGLGRCIALPSLRDVEYVCSTSGSPAASGAPDSASDAPQIPPVFFQFARFDEPNPKPCDNLFQVFPNLRFMLPEVVLVQNADGVFLQVNSLGPVYEGRVERFASQAEQAPPRMHRSIPYRLEPDDRGAWNQAMEQALAAIDEHRVHKVVLARRQRLVADEPFSSKDVLVNLIDGPSVGTVFIYRYGDVFFCGCTPELLVRKQGSGVSSMCLAGTTGVGASDDERQRLAEELLADQKNVSEHRFVTDFIRAVVERNCYDVDMPERPGIRSLAHVQHLHTPVAAKVMEGRTLYGLAEQLHPTPALAGTPVGEAMMLIRSIESFNRGFFGGPVGVVDAAGDGEYSVAIRSGVFDGHAGWVYAGCGIVAGSDAASEYDEIDMKLKTITSGFDAPAD